MADPKQLALQHFDKALVGAAGVYLLVCGAGFFSTPAQLSKNDKLAAAIATVDKYMKTAQPEPMPEPDWLDRLEKRLDPGTLGDAGTSPYPSWVLHKRPQFLYGTVAPKAKHTAKHYAANDVRADAGERGKIDVAWGNASDNEYVIVTRYEVERRVGADGEWEKIGETAGDVRTYTDENIVSRTDYYYRVVSVAEIDRDNPVVRHEGMELDPAEERKVSDEAGPVTTKRDVFIIPITVVQVTDQDLIANPNAQESAYVRVYKWDPETSTFEKQAYNVKVGESIGGKRKRGGKEYDFTTGATLVDVEIRKRRHALGHDEPVQVIIVRYEDGSEEESNDKDKPAELQD